MQYKMFDTYSMINLIVLLVFSLFECVENYNVSATLTAPDAILQKCYPKYGCYSIGSPWSSVTRPVSLFPEAPEKVNPQYCLYTRKNPKTCDKLYIDDPTALFRSNFIPNGQTYFIAHGFVESGNKTWIKELTAELLDARRKRANANVIVIDWSSGSDPPYTQAVANIRLVGVMTAHLIKMMKDQGVGLEVEKIHVIGHSLGAHLASYIGTALRRSFRMRLGRITGLDPADPHFANTDNLVRLDPSDAIFVDNIHTDASSFVTGGLGYKEPLGHVDFYPNGGQDQPGCHQGLMKIVNFEDGSLFKGMGKKLSCNHVRSYMYFIETVNSPHKFWAVECKSWEQYRNGSCFRCDYNHRFRNGTQCARFGFHSISSFANRSSLERYRSSKTDFMLVEPPSRRHVTMFLITGSSSPFYRSQYRVSWKISESSHEIGKFKLKIIGKNGSTELMDLTEKVKYYDPGSEHRIVVAGKSIGRIESAVLLWSYETSLMNPLTWRVNLPSISIKHMTIDSLDTRESLTFCLPDNTVLTSGAPKQLVHCIV